LLALAFAPANQGGGGLAGTLIMITSFVLIFYFLLRRPQRQQQKRHEAMVSGLRRGDEVATVGGIIGRIVHIKDGRITLKTAEDTRIVIEQDKVARRLAAASSEEEG
jgi:preprotein translocase subunit YajC